LPAPEHEDEWGGRGRGAPAREVRRRRGSGGEKHQRPVRPSLGSGNAAAAREAQTVVEGGAERMGGRKGKRDVDGEARKARSSLPWLRPGPRAPSPTGGVQGVAWNVRLPVRERAKRTVPD